MSGGRCAPQGPPGPPKVEKVDFYLVLRGSGRLSRWKPMLIGSSTVSGPGLPVELSGDRPPGLWIDSRGALPSILKLKGFDGRAPPAVVPAAQVDFLRSRCPSTPGLVASELPRPRPRLPTWSPCSGPGGLVAAARERIRGLGGPKSAFLSFSLCRLAQTAACTPKLSVPWGSLGCPLSTGPRVGGAQCPPRAPGAPKG